MHAIRIRTDVFSFQLLLWVARFDLGEGSVGLIVEVVLKLEMLDGFAAPVLEFVYEVQLAGAGDVELCPAADVVHHGQDSFVVVRCKLHHCADSYWAHWHYHKRNFVVLYG